MGVEFTDNSSKSLALLFFQELRTKQICKFLDSILEQNSIICLALPKSVL